MKNIYKNGLFLLLMLFANFINSQNVNISYEVRISNANGVRSTEGSSCWESGNEEYSANVRVDGTGVCVTCDNNGDCNYGHGTVVRTETDVNKISYSIGYDMFEDDGGNRCDYNSGDDCRANSSFTVNFYNSWFPSALNAYNNYTDNQVYNSSSSEHRVRLDHSWRYTGTGSSITPACNSQSIAYAAGSIRSFSASLSTANTYRFSTCGSAGDTYIRIYGPDGYTIVAFNDNSGSACAGNLASVDFNPGSNGTYYIEISNTSRAALTNAGNLVYQIIGPYGGTATLGTLSNAGPINFCDAGGDYGTAISLSGYTNGLPTWEWGSNNGTWNNWVTGDNAGDCCFPKKTSNSDGNADRIQVRVIGCTTTSYSSTVLIRNEYNEAPSSLSKSLDNVCPGTSVTLNANFLTATNMNGKVQFYSGSCGGTPIAEVSGNGTTTVSTTITAPATNTTYYARYTGAYSGCGTTACVSTLLTINFGAPTATAATAGTCTQWRANWNAVNGATSYRLDVATDNAFTSMVINDLNVGNVTSYDLNLPLGTYYYRVRAVNSCFTSANSNTISFTLSNVANNDAYRNAIDITANIAGGSAYNGSFNNSSYGLESGEPTPQDIYASAWYKFTTPAGGFPSINAYVVTSDNSAVAIYRSNGNTCPFSNLTNLGDNYECSGASGVSVTTNCLPGNTTYYLQFGSTDCIADGATKGNFNVSVTPGTPSGKDNVCSAHDFGAITGGYNSGDIYYNNSCLSTESGEPRTGDMTNTMWYKFTTPSNGLTSIDVDVAEAGEGANYTAVAVYKKTGACSGTTGLSEVGFERWCNANGGTLTVNCLEGGIDYYIQLGTGYNFDLCTNLGMGGRSTGRYRLKLTASTIVAAPDNICSAIQVGSGTIGVNQSATTATYTNNCSSLNTGGHTDPVNAQGNDATDWFYFTTPTVPAAQYFLSFNNIADFGTFGGLEGEVYKKTGGTCPPILTYVGSWDPTACGVVEESGVFCLDPSSTYYVMVDAEQDGACGGRGRYQLNVRGINAVKGVDLCSVAATDLGTLNTGTTIGDASGTNRWNNFCATAAGDPNPGWGTGAPEQPVWFKFTTTATSGRDVDFEAFNDPASLGDQINLRLALYEGCGGTKIFAEGTQPFYGESVNVKCLAPSTTYYLMVDGWDNLVGGGEGYFGLTVKDNGPYAGNDLLCNVSSVSTYDIGTAATVAANVGSVNNISKTGTNIGGTNCFDPNPTWGGVCAASFNNDNDYGVWYKLPAATNRKDILIKGVTTGSGDLTDLQYALYEASAPTNCLNPGATLISGSYYGSLAWNSVAGLCASADEDHIYTCLDPAKDYYLMVDGNDQVLSCGTGNFTLNTYYPMEGGTLPCNAVPLPGVNTPTWSGGIHKIDLAANFCGTPGGHAGAPTAPWTYEKPVWWKFVAPPSGSVEIRMKSDSTNLGDEIRPRLWVFKENTPGTCSDTLLNTTDLDQKDPDDIIGIGDPDLLTEILDVRCLTPGQTYYLVTDGLNTIAEVCGAGTKVGFFSLEIKDLGQAKRDNDNICGATPGRVAGNPYYFTPTADWKTVNKEAELTKSDQDNYCFVIENEPDASDPTWGGAWSTSNNARGGWYSFRAPPSGKVEIELENKSFTADQIDAQIAVYRIKNGNTCDQVQTYTPASGTSSLLEFYGSSNDTYAGVLADEDLTVSCLMPDSLYYIYFEGVNSNTLGVNDLATGQFHLTVRSYPQDPPAKNDNKCNPIYLGKPANATLGSGNPGYINASSSANFNRNLSGSTGTPPTLGGNGVTLVKATNNHGATIPGESTLSCSPNPGCIDGLSEDYDRNLYPFNNFCATAVGDSVPSTWGGFAGAGDKMPRKTVWFMFQAPSDLDGDGNEAVLIELNQETIAINSHKDGMDLRVAVYESSDNTCNGNFYELNSDYDQGNYDEDVKVTCLEPDRYYWIMVDGSSFFSGSDEGYFGMKISRVAPDPRPSNDYICNAHTFSNSFFTGAAVGRTRDTNICARITRTNIDPTPENDPSGFDLDHTVWYKFTAPTTGVPPTGAFAVQVDVNGWGPGLFGYSDKMDPQIAIFESQDGTCNWGTNGTNMVEIASEYDILPFTESMKAYCIIPGKTYYVMVDGSALNSQGYFDISINDIAPITLPTNDDLVNATALTFPSNIGAGNTTTSALAHNYCTDIEPGELDAWTLYDIDNTVWWKFQVPNSGAYANQHVDLQIRLRSDPGNTKNDKINLLGAVYHQIGGTGGSPGTYPNINENIGTGTNIAIFDEDINLTCLKPGDWYFLQIDGYSGPFNIFRAQGQGWYDVQLEVTGLTPNQGNDSVCGAIVIPVNNIAQPTSGAPYNNICKTTQANETLPWINADSKTVWFKFIPPASGNINIQVQSEASDDIDAQIAVYQSLIPVASSACPPVDQLILAGKDYDALAWGEDMNIKCLDNQYWHYLQVNSANVGLVREGKFKVKIQDIGGTTNPPYNDNICNARDFGNITNANGTGAFNIVGDSNKCATIQLNEPSTISNPTSDIQKSVWYKFTAPTSGRAKITLHDQDGFLSGIDPEMKLYEGTLSGCPSASPTFTNFTVLESAYNPLPNFPTATTGDEVIEYECFIPGQIYYIQVDGTTVGGPQGFFDIKIEDMIPNYPSSPKKPVNDEPTLATTLTVNQQQCPVPIGITSEGDELQGNGTWLTGNYKKPTITKKDLIGTCNTLDNCGDIWYKFTMPNDDCMLGSVVAVQGYSDRAPNVGDQYYNDLKIIAYRGTPGSLVPIECGKVDGNFATNDYFHFEVTGTPGETIYLQVFDQNYNDTDNDDEEDFFICVGKRFGTDKCQSLSNVPFMEYSKDYCWNIEGASGETPASAYGETNSATNPTENSAYFKFKMTSNPCDSLNFTIWQPAPPNLFLQGGGTNLNQIVSLSVYREDNALCDGTIDGALISKTYICSSPTAILDNTLRFNVGLSNLDTNKTYVVQIDGQGQAESGYINDGFIRIDTFQRCVNVQAVTYDDTSTGYWKCVDGWRYYHDRNNVIIFALYPNGNNFDGIAKIRYKSNYDEASICSIPMAEYSMRRIWDFHMTSGSINPLNPVKVRFYYIATEKQAIINAALAFQGSCGGYYEPFEWFKTANGVQYIPTNPAQINPGIINAAYSETACLGSSLFGSPNGCNTLTALDNQYACNGTLYVELGAITGFSGGTGAAGVGPWQNASPLPVELISFTGYNDGAKNVLNWSTASERNTLKFEVERASSNTGQFTYIGELPAAGNSSQPLAYTLDDNRPNIGENYYRLKMIDRDGSFKYSHTILIRNEEVITSNAINGIYPNPTSHLINIDYQSVNSGNAVLKIVNVIGQEISSIVQAIVKGKQIIQIDVSSLADGVYILNIQDSQNGKVLQSKFVKD